jgi:hypothetical protein
MSATLITVFKVAIVPVAIAVGFGLARVKNPGSIDCRRADDPDARFIRITDSSLAVIVPFRQTDSSHCAKIVAQLRPELRSDWDIADARAFRTNARGRHLVVFEGPYKLELSDSKEGGCGSVSWNFYGLRDEQYELEILLLRKTERMSYSSTTDAILVDNGITVRSVALEEE